MFTKWFKQGSQLANQLVLLGKDCLKSPEYAPEVLEISGVMIGGNGFTGVVKSVSVSSSMGYTEWNSGSQIHRPLTAKHLWAKEFDSDYSPKDL